MGCLQSGMLSILASPPAPIHLDPPASIFPLPYSPLTSGLAAYRAFYHSPLPPLPPRVLRCSRAPWLPEHYSGSPLLRAHPTPSRRQPLSRFAGYMTYPAPPISRWGEDGFSSCLACPCHRAVPITPLKSLAASVSCDHRCCLRPKNGGSAFRSKIFEATYGFICITAR